MKALNIQYIFTGLKHFGWLIALSSIYILTIKFSNISLSTEVQRLDLNVVITLIGLFSFIYAVTICTMPYAWKYLLLAEEKEIKLQDSIIAYGNCQFTKYNLLGFKKNKRKQYCSEVFGLFTKTLISTTIWEVSLIFISGGLLCAYLLIAGAPSSISSFTLLFVTLLIFYAIPSLKRVIEVTRFKSLLSYFLYHLISGFIFAIMLYNIMGTHLTYTQFLVAIGAYVLAWIVGFVTPGAPNGIGVRELALIFILSPWFPEVSLLISVLAMRVINFAGELILYLITSYFMKRSNEVKLQSNA